MAATVTETETETDTLMTIGIRTMTDTTEDQIVTRTTGIRLHQTFIRTDTHPEIDTHLETDSLLVQALTVILTDILRQSIDILQE